MYDDASHPEGLLDLTNEQYHSGPGLSSTQLKTIAQSPLAYWDAYINPDREPREYKHCFAVGDGTHKLVLEPGTFERTYFVGFDKSAYPNALDSSDQLKAACRELGLMVSGTKAELAERLVTEGGMEPERIMLMLEKQHLASRGDRQEIPARDYKNMLGMLTAIERSEAGPLLQGAECEQSFYWRDGAGILRKCRTDAITANGQFVLDLKTTDDVSRRGFGQTIARLGYHVSAAWYLDVLQGLYGSDAPTEFAYIAVQKTRPYDVAVHYLTERQIYLGRLRYQKYLRTLMECLSTGAWPGAAGGEFLEAELPEWEMRQIEYLEGAAL